MSLKSENECFKGSEGFSIFRQIFFRDIMRDDSCNFFLKFYNVSSIASKYVVNNDNYFHQIFVSNRHCIRIQKGGGVTPSATNTQTNGQTDRWTHNLIVLKISCAVIFF